MIKQHVIHNVFKLSVLGLVGLGAMMVEVQPSFACNGRCQANRMCADLMNKKGLKDRDQRKAEYEKCQRDPQNYKN
jgi:hypothetical protein